MNITEVIKRKGLPYRMEGDIMVQTEDYDLVNEGITSLDGFKQNGTLFLKYNQIKSLKGFEQRGFLDLDYNEIRSLEGFNQNGHLYLGNNRITSLDGFKQNGVLYLRNNRITSLSGFEQNGDLDISYNQITSLEGFEQTGYLYLNSNQITSLDGFKQNGDLYLSNNQIASLKGFERDGSRLQIDGNPAQYYSKIETPQQQATINNIEIIKPLLAFPKDDTFYHLQILKRKKENPDIGSNNTVVKTYYISSIEYLETKMDEIINLCDFHNARAYINLNRRSYEQVAFQTLKKVTDQIMNKDFRSARKAYESVCGAHSAAKNDKRWIIDVDEPEISPIMLATIDHKCEPFTEGDTKIWARIPTKNGWHLITSPFNLKTFKEEYPEVEVHKNNPTLLYS